MTRDRELASTPWAQEAHSLLCFGGPLGIPLQRCSAHEWKAGHPGSPADWCLGTGPRCAEGGGAAEDAALLRPQRPFSSSLPAGSEPFPRRPPGPSRAPPRASCGLGYGSTVSARPSGLRGPRSLLPSRAGPSPWRGRRPGHGARSCLTGAHLQRELAAKPRARGIWGSWAVTCHPSLPLRCSFPRRSVAEAHPSSPSHRRPRKSTRTAGRGAGRVPRPQASSLQRWGDPVPPSPPPAPLSLQEAGRSA